MSDRLRLTLAQLNPTVGDIEGNAAKVLDVWLKHEHDSDLVVFPELFLSGYPPEDLVHNVAFMRMIHEQVLVLCQKTTHFKCAAILPTPWIAEDNQIINALLLIRSGEIAAIQPKVELPNYSVFDEPRTFVSGQLPLPLPINGVNVGFLICEDLWFDNVAKHLAENGAQLLISVNASPFDNMGKLDNRLEVAEACVDETGLGLVYLNTVGGQDELVFDGRSFIMHANGQIAHSAHAFAEDVIHVQVAFEPSPDETDQTISVFEKTKSLETQPECKVAFEETYYALMLGLKDYVHKNGFSKVLLGLSGGIDSALVAAIAVDTLGAENVRGIMLPSEFTSTESLEDAEECARNLGIQYEIIPIKDAVHTFEKIIPDLKGLAHENTQSRIRGLILMALSNISGEMLLSTGNKSEIATGYATLYGDMNGGFNPLKDLYKTQVYEISRQRNMDKIVIPERIISKAPTAELRPNQTDQDSLPPYDILDNILACLIDFDTVDFSIAEEGLGELRDICLEYPDIIEKVAKLLRTSEFKRFQACPGPRISPRAFGKDRRYPITNKFLNRIEKP